jgi:hypothetical protein
MDVHGNQSETEYIGETLVTLKRKARPQLHPARIEKLRMELFAATPERWGGASIELRQPELTKIFPSL